MTAIYFYSQRLINNHLFRNELKYLQYTVTPQRKHSGFLALQI